jgi:hypothetical protein
MQVRYRRALTPVAITAVLLALVVAGSASAVKPLASVQGTGGHSTSPWDLGSSLLYSQNPNFNGAFASQNDPNGFGNFATSYDNFSLNTSTNITQVQWVGSYFNPPNQAPITSWTLNFYADNGGVPGNSLYQTTVNGTANETFLQNDTLGDPTYLYSLNVNFAATAGTKYWLSVVPTLGFPPQWGWETSSQGDGSAYQCFFGTCGSVSSDLAFALFGGQTTVPEPGTLVMLGTGILGLAGVIRRKLV